MRPRIFSASDWPAGWPGGPSYWGELKVRTVRRRGQSGQLREDVLPYRTVSDGLVIIVYKSHSNDARNTERMDETKSSMDKPFVAKEARDEEIKKFWDAEIAQIRKNGKARDEERKILEGKG